MTRPSRYAKIDQIYNIAWPRLCIAISIWCRRPREVSQSADFPRFYNRSLGQSRNPSSIRIILGLRQSHRFARLPREADFTGSVNIVNPSEFTLLKLVEELIAFADSRSNLEFKPLPSEVTKQCQSDIRVAKQMFARRLNLCLEEDLNKTISNSANLG